VLLLTATPFNKHYSDISNQIRLFVDETEDLHVQPDHFVRWLRTNGNNAIQQFMVQHNLASLSCLKAFEFSNFPEDWRDLMRLFLVRRTRQFIIKYYAKFDPEKNRYYVTLNGKPNYLPQHQFKTIKFPTDPKDPQDQYARLFDEETVKVIENLELPRYGLANYLRPEAQSETDETNLRIIRNLNRAGKRLIGFCRTNLFKRLESSGYSFLLSIQRHIIRNLVTLHAYKTSQPVPIGSQDFATLDPQLCDTDEEFAESFDSSQHTQIADLQEISPSKIISWSEYLARASKRYDTYKEEYRDQFDWLDAKFFKPELANALESDAKALFEILQKAGPWNPETDAKLQTLYHLLTQIHPQDKVLVFTQFADTAMYLYTQLAKKGIKDIDVLTTDTRDPVTIVRRFSPNQNGGLPNNSTELRVLIATDILAEGQKPSRLPHHRKLRLALGHHPTHPTRWPCRSYRANTRHRPRVLFLAGPRRRKNH